MSDIQRYVVEDEVALADNYDNEGILKLVYLSAVVVKYDDHIAEVKRIQAIQHAQAEAMWEVNRENKQLQSKIAELEEHNMQLQSIHNMTTNQIKAEGIREARHLAQHDSVIWVRLGEYADKLEKGDE